MNDFQVSESTAALPISLSRLGDLAYNLWWSWHPEARALFRSMDPGAWERVNGNPVALLHGLSAESLSAFGDDLAFVARVSALADAMDADAAGPAWYQRERAGDSDELVAYFCAEFGISPALPLYSGGLGVLAGDHLKSASDLGVPLVAVGLAYREGYFVQELDAGGEQLETPCHNDFQRMPMRRVLGDSGQPLLISVPLASRHVAAQLWQVKVGRVSLFLLDTDVESNDAGDRRITAQLYGGDSSTRIAQEIILGIGGVRALAMMGLSPTVYHMNEGHSAFMAVERIRQTMEGQGLDFEEAHALCAASNVFTTHTPVPAGFDIFTREQMDHYLPEVHRELEIERERFLKLGAHLDDLDLCGGFNMAYLALRASAHLNGVSRLHGDVSRAMWSPMWPGVDIQDVPITSVTNGIHTRTWLGAGMQALLDGYLEAGWLENIAEPKTWACVDEIPDGLLWQARQQARASLVTYVRRRHRLRQERLGGTSASTAVLNPAALTIGFARRFATYKRATLLLRHPERLKALLTQEERPIQFVFAGKAHPRDLPGKALIRELVEFVQREGLEHAMVFLEGYDIGVGRHLVQGVDVWLNNPRRPKEASGTSGMKVVPNGGLNLSILDGWWAEAYDGGNGWAIGDGRSVGDPEAADAAEAEALFEMLESHLVPEFYGRDAHDVPTAWTTRMKRSMSALSPRFDMARMVREYVDNLYLPAAHDARRLDVEGHARIRALVTVWQRLLQGWCHVLVSGAAARTAAPTGEASASEVSTKVFLGALQPSDVRVEYVNGSVSLMTCVHRSEDGWATYHLSDSPAVDASGPWAIRVLPAMGAAAPVRGIGAIWWRSPTTGTL